MHGDGTWFVQALGDHHIAEGAIQSGHLDDVKTLVCPINVSCGGQRCSSGTLVDLCTCCMNSVEISTLFDHPVTFIYQ